MLCHLSRIVTTLCGHRHGLTNGRVKHSLAVLFLICPLFLLTLYPTTSMRMPRTTSLDLSERFVGGFLTGLREAAVLLPASVLLWCLVIVLTGAFRRLTRRSVCRRLLYETSDSQQLTIASSLFLLIFAVLLPGTILAYRGAVGSVGDFVVKYAIELVLSVVVVSVTVGGWTLAMAGGGSADDVLMEFDRGEASEEEVIEMEQTQSLEKWMREGDFTGWYELWEDVRFGRGLRSEPRELVERELQRVQQSHRPAAEEASNGEYEEHLRVLLHPEQAEHWTYVSR